MLSDLGTMEESTTADSQQEVGNQRAEQRPRITMSPSGFELPPEASDQITTLHKEIKEMVRVGGVRVVSRASRSTSVLGGKERLVTFARYSWHVGMQLLRDVIAYTFAPTCFDEMFA